MKIDEVIKRIKKDGPKITNQELYVIVLELAQHIKNLEAKDTELKKLIDKAVVYP